VSPSKTGGMIGGTLRRRGMTGLLVAAVAVAGFVVPTYAAAAKPHLRTVWSRYSFDGKRNGFLFVAGSFQIRPGSFFAVLDEVDTHGPHPESFGDVVDLDAFGASETYGSLGDRNLCTAPVQCQVVNGRMTFTVEFTVNGDGKHREHLRQYIVARGAHLVVHDVFLKGWTPAHRQGGATRRTDDDADGAGVMAAGTGVGTDLGVSAPGPAGGSLALAVPACDQIGAGLMTLSGGTQTQTAICPTTSISAVARHRTTWQLSGAVGGATSYATRLLVIAA